jgi:hypothetical protein
MPQTPQFDPTAAYQPAATTAVFDPNADYAPAKKTAPQAGLLDREIQLDDHWDATGSGLQSIGRGVRDAVKGTWDTLAKPPQDKTETAIGAIGPAALPLYRMLRSHGPHRRGCDASRRRHSRHQRLGRSGRHLFQSWAGNCRPGRRAGDHSR